MDTHQFSKVIYCIPEKGRDAQVVSAKESLLRRHVRDWIHAREIEE
jgi:hypothetical protein